MDKIKIGEWESTEVRTQIMRCMAGINELIEGYEETTKRVEELEDELKERYYNTSGWDNVRGDYDEEDR